MRETVDQHGDAPMAELDQVSRGEPRRSPVIDAYATAAGLGLIAGLTVFRMLGRRVVRT